MFIGHRWLMSKETQDVKLALWDGFKRLAKRLPDHHILAVDLLRTHDDQTVAVFTVVRDHEPVQMIVVGDAQGRVQPHDCGPRAWMRAPDATEQQSATGERLAMEASISPADDPADPADPAGFATRTPPPQQEPSPGVVILATAALALVFGVGDPRPTSS